MFKINNRRYLGSKFKLLSFIQQIVSKHCDDCQSFIDLFGGTGVVASAFNKDYKIIVNDILQSNTYAYETFLSNAKINKSKIIQILKEYNEINIESFSDNYYSINFADTFLSQENMKRVGIIRDNIDVKFAQKNINKREKAILITSLLYAIDKIANTVGHYDAFRRTGDLTKNLYLDMPDLNDQYNKNNVITQLDANKFVKQYNADILYCDPPYNSRQYCDAYHFLENVAVNNQPEVIGVARKMDRSHLKSDYCTTKAVAQFKQLIKDANVKFIIISYNNTGNKINSRSNAKISDEEILEILKTKGKVFTYEQNFNAFTTGKTKVEEHKERLFVCEVGHFDKPIQKKISKNHIQNHQIIKSPLNYTGGKAKLLPQIKDKLPQSFSTFYDVFSGGCNVGINVEANKIVCVDNNKKLIELLSFIKPLSYIDILASLEDKIKFYGLSNSYLNGYEYYGCNSANGLGSFNKKGYLKLREDYNCKKEPLLFLLLIMFGFNNQIRFNNKGEFNLPVGKRDLNSNLRKKLKYFIEALQYKNITFINKDFRNLDIEEIAKEKAFLYLDPPYILGTATYNESGGWTEKDEIDLLSFLKKCDENGIKFALSNVMKHKGKTHTLLLNWCIEQTFNINYLNHSYANSSYQVKDRTLETQEVLITNY